MKYLRHFGQAELHTLISVSALVAAVAGPILWFTSVQQVNAVQDTQIENLEEQHVQIEEHYDTLASKIDALLLKNNINPNTVVNKSIEQ